MGFPGRANSLGKGTKAETTGPAQRSTGSWVWLMRRVWANRGQEYDRRWSGTGRNSEDFKRSLVGIAKALEPGPKRRGG